MSLSNVLMWTDKHGYRPVTELEAAQVYHETVSAHSGIFICGICTQAVTFTAGNIRVRHFRHNSAAENKDCEERSVQYGNAQPNYRFQQTLHTLPFRLTKKYRLELGLLALSKDCLIRYSGQTLRIAGQGTKTFSYDIAERLLPERLTWLDVGNAPAKSYALSLPAGLSLPSQWPHQVDGIDTIALFDAETGKRLPPRPDVEVDREYIVAIRGKPYWIPPSDASQKIIPPHEHGWSGWTLCKVKALRFSKMAARFFLQFQAMLTNRVPSIFPLWPAFVRTPHLIYHDAEELFIFVGGEDTKVRLFPPASQAILKSGRARIIRFTAGIRKQVLTGASAQLLEVGRTHMLRYDYFIRRKFDQVAPLPEVKITNSHGAVISEDWVESISPGSTIGIFAPFDGEILLENDGVIFDRQKLKSSEELRLKVNTGQIVTIFQGLDRIRSLVFARPGQKRFEGGQNKALWDDALLYRRLSHLTGDEVPAVHLLAVATNFFRGYRATAAWLRMRKAEGRISARALTQLRALMEK